MISANKMFVVGMFVVGMFVVGMFVVGTLGSVII